MPAEIAVASINHGLREEAADEVALVESVCAALGVPFTAIEVSLGRGNLQAKAREARYQALNEWALSQGIAAVATAHHADDQAETLLMRLVRGSGLHGLAGVRASADLPGGDVALIRPLLWARKAELEALVEAAGLIPARDPSNADHNFDRVRMRDHLADHEWLDAEAIATSAGHLAEAARALEWYAQKDWEEQVVFEEGVEGPSYRYVANAPRVIQIDTLCRIVSALGGRVTRGETGRAAERLCRGENASLGGVLATADIQKVDGSTTQQRVWLFRPEPPRNTH